jgi:hypothetical protein
MDRNSSDYSGLILYIFGNSGVIYKINACYYGGLTMDGVNQNDEQDREQVFNQLRSEQQVRDRDISAPVLNDKEKIVAVRKNENGEITAVRTEAGRELDYESTLNEAKVEHIDGIRAFNKNGRYYLTSDPDGYIDSLPSF